MQPTTTVLQEPKVYPMREVKNKGKEMDKGQDSDDILRVIDLIGSHSMIFKMVTRPDLHTVSP